MITLLQISCRGSSEKLGWWELAEGRSLGRLEVWGYYTWEIFENMCADLCILVYFGDIRSSKV